MIMRGVRRGYALAIVLAGTLAPAAWGQSAHTIAEREAASNERRELRDHIQEIQKEIARAEKTRSEAADALKASEQAISDATRKLADIQARRDQAAAELKKLESQISSLQSDMGKRQQALASLLRRQYATGGVTPWSALLSGDDPQESGRTLGYMGYVSQARSAAIQSVRAELAKLKGLQDAAAARRGELDELAVQQQAQRQERIAQTAERQRVLDEIGVHLAEQHQQASRMTSDEERLSGLITEINRALEKQALEAARKRAEEERLAQEREARLAREREQARLLAEKAARQAAAQAAARVAREAQLARQRETAQAPVETLAVRSSLARRDEGTPGAGAVPALPDEGVAPVVAIPAAPAVVAVEASSRPAAGAPAAEPVPEPAPPRTPAPTVVASIAPAPAPMPAVRAKVNFADLRGQLRLPAQGQVAGRFGDARPAGGSWRGIFIRAREQTPVHAVAAGTVVFSGWLRGFGNLLILDHGSEYLTVYGNNEAILKEVGDTVAAGEAVASAGSSGGQPESGIYFELRHRGSPVDPLLWAKLR